MKKILLMLVLSAMSAGICAARDWKGRVLDENGNPLQFATVVLMEESDSTVLGGATTDENGAFSISSDSGNAVLMVTMVGYRSRLIRYSADCTVTMEPENTILEGAVATAVMPKTRITGEGLQTSVRGSTLENVGTANDVLAKTPGIIKGQNGLEVVGKGAPLVYINGRKLTDATELDRLQSNEIQSVEVISNPGAQYDASVRSVVRIRTIRRQGDGFGFNASFTDEQSLRNRFNDPGANIDFNYRVNDVDVFAGVNLSKSDQLQESDLYSETFGNPCYTDSGWTKVNYMHHYANVNAGANWQITDAHSVGFKLNYGTRYNMSQYQQLWSTLTRNGLPYDETLTEGRYRNGDNRPYIVNSNLYYSGKAGKLGIDFNFDWFKTGDSEFADIVESSVLEDDASICTENTSDNNLYAAKLVLSYPVWKGMLQLGTEESFSRRGDAYVITGSYIPPSSSKVREDNIAAFANYGFALPKAGQFSAGVRYEHVNYSYEDMTAEGSFERRYDNIFPTLSWAGVFGPVQMSASYSIKTGRPDFGMLGSTLRYNSKYIIQSGNSALQPQLINGGNVMANWKWLTLVTDYSRIDDAIFSWAESYNDQGVMLVKPRNVDTPLRMLSAFLSMTPTVGIWSMNYMLGMQQQWLTIELPDPRQGSGLRSTSFSDSPLFLARLLNTLSLKHDWQIELGGEYHSPGYTQNVMIRNHYFDLTAAIQKSFLKDKSLVIRLEGRNLTGLARYDLHADYGSYVLSQTNLMDNRRVVLSIRYRFNTAISKYKGTGAGQDVISRMK